MEAVFPVLLTLHFLGLVAGFGGGIALSQVGPRLANASEGELGVLGKLESSFTTIALVGVGLLLITGPLMLWSRFGDAAGLPVWFSLKMAFVALAVISIVANQLAKRRFRSGQRSAFKWMLIAGRVTGISLLLAVVFAVMTFQ